ncbi:tyrosine-protein phosphatase [Rhizomonospora bruguierae]|uniref:tyrosine-protein phosphatase n=1 Tax=Rhizomonospora bruguierae TaxID=1581705 RepID=UPI001BD0892A|nr:tyrosine-protein phosphatase [Micromonospora sp. NBRC 107566]
MATVRSVTFENLYNFRDLGGLPVAPGGTTRTDRLYRSDSVAYASASDTAWLVERLGLATVVDLRGEREVDLFGRGLLARTGVRYVAAPIDKLAEYDDLAGYYLGVLAERGDVLVTAIRGLLEPGALPAVIHCEAGCDRTGVLVATILSLIGVPDADICADYLLTSAAVAAIIERDRWLATRLNLVDAADLNLDYDDWVLAAETMPATLAGMRARWGDAAGWAAAHGLRPEELDRLRETLVAA